MRVRVDHPVLLPELVAFLRLRPDLVAEQLGEDELELSLVGSYCDEARRLELDLRLRAWEDAHPGVKIDPVDDPEHRGGGRSRLRALR